MASGAATHINVALNPVDRALSLFAGAVRICVLTLACLVTAVGAAGGATEFTKTELTQAERDWLSKHPVLRLGVDNGWPPLEFVNERGAYAGIAAEFISLLEQRLGITLEIEKDLPWADVVKAVENGDLDAFSLITETPQRRKYLNFTDTYLSFPYVIVTLDDQSFIDGIGDMADKTVSVVRNYAIHDLLLRDHPDLRLHLADSVRGGLDAVLTGKAYAFIGNLAVVTHVLREGGITNLKVSGQTRYRSNLAMAFRKELAPAVGIFNKALTSITPFERDRIYARWVRLAFDTKVDTSSIVAIITVGLIAVLLLLMWNRGLKREIAKRLQVEKDLKSVKSEAETLMKAVESGQNGLAILDRDGNFTYLNKAHLETFGYEDVGDLRGKSWKVLYDPVAADRVEQEAMATLSDTGTWNGELDAIRRDGTRFSEEIWLTALPDGGLICECQDISERVEFVSELQAAKERADLANTAKSEFLATMSHEIRTPMNGVLGMVSVLKTQNLTPSQESSVQVIKESGEALLDILNDILDLSKIEAGKVELEKGAFSVERMLDMAATLWSSRAHAKGLDLVIRNEMTGNDVVRNDGNRLRQVLFNLISNAIKYTEAGEIVVTVSEGESGDGRSTLRFEVADSGIGLTLEQQSKVFKPFVQADSSTTRKYGGTGLGLAISKGLIDLMGGEIGVESAPGEGAKFWFAIEAEAVADSASDGGTPADAEASTSSGKNGALRILIAEDNHLNQLVMRSMLMSMECDLCTVKDGHEAVEEVQRAEYDVVLMDVRMPKMDGPTATKEIRALPGPVSQTPIIAVTANAMKGDRERYLEAGMNDYVSKPIDPKALTEAIERNVRRPDSTPAGATQAAS